MKVKIKSVLKSSLCKFKWMEESQVIYQAGNNLCIGEISKPASEFINLDPNNSHLFDFVVSPNHHFAFTAEQNISANRIEIASYSINTQLFRKHFSLSQVQNYFPLESIESIQLLADQFDSYHVFVITKNKNGDYCISLVDLGKCRLISHGFVGPIDSVQACSLSTFEVSISGKGILRRLKAQDGVWVVQEKIPKKLNNMEIISHHWMLGQKIVAATATNLYIIEQNEVIQTIPVCSGDQKITQTRKLEKGIIVFTSELELKLYIEQNEQGIFGLVEDITLPFKKVHLNPNIPLQEEPERIAEIQINKTQEDILIVTSNSRTWHSKIQQISGVNKEHYFSFEKIENKTYGKQEIGSICTSNGQSYAIVSNTSKIELWDLNRVNLLTTMEFSTIEDKAVIRCVALNPDGHSFVIGFPDKIKFYRILINKFKQYAEYSLRKSKLVQYSHGGQLVACISGKGVNTNLTILNTLTMKEVHVFKLGFRISQIIWNEFDDEIYVSGLQTSTINIFKISTKSKVNSMCFNGKITFMRYDYLSKKIMASIDNKVLLINPNQEYSFTQISTYIKDLHYIYPIEGNYLATDRKGTLYISNMMEFEKCQQISLFQNKPFKLEYHKGNLIAYTSPSNSFVIQLKKNNEQKIPQQREDIVLVEREQIDKFFERVRLLQSQLQQTQNMTGIKLEEERKKYNESLQQNSQIFKNQMQFIQRRFMQLQAQKNHQQKDNARVFQDLENGQIKSVNDLEKVYDLKIRLQKEKYLALEQESLQQKMKYQNIIKQLQKKYHDDIEKVRKQYSSNLQQQIKTIQNQKNRTLEYKRKMQSKIIDLEEQSELTLLELQLSKDNRIKNLIEKQTKLERQYDSTMIQLHNMRDDLDTWKHKYEVTNEKVKENEKIIKEYLNRVKIQESEIQKKNRIIEEKNTTVEQQAHQIQALEKAKYVLNFRTTEIRKGLEPKDALIDKLKSQFFKLEEEYKKQNQKNFQLSQKLEKIQKLSTTVRKQNNEVKNLYKLKDRLHEQLCYELFVLVNNVDPKQWNAGLVKLYQNYAQEEKHKTKTQKKSDNTSEEINRHLIHVEQSLHQVATGNQKMLKGKQKQVVRKMKENAELVYDLNVMRKQLNEKDGELNERRTQIARLKRELNESAQGNHRSTRANTAQTGVTRRAISRDPNNLGGQTADWIDLSIRRTSDYAMPQKNKRSRVMSSNKTMMWRQDGRKDKSRISDLARQLQSAKNTIKRQDRMIQQLNQRLLGLPEEELS